ncbi:MAG: ZIP family metal transporter [bacterium]|nr:ZIP family metal transporter [bacterium]
MSTTLYIFSSVLLVSLISIIGVATIALNKDRLLKRLSFLISLAVGALLGDAFLHLIPQAYQTEDSTVTSLFLIFGIVAFFAFERFLRRHHHATTPASDQAESRHLGQLILASDGLHNFMDGVIIGVSYLISIELGLATTLAVALHEIPQEIGDFSVLIYSGYTRGKALLYNFASALMAIAGAAVAIVLGTIPQEFLQRAIAFAAGSFVYIAISDLMPELRKNDSDKRFASEMIGIGLGMIAMYLLLFLE